MEPADRGTTQVAIVTTYSNPDPESEYELAERIRKDVGKITDMSLLISVLDTIRSRVTSIHAAKKQHG